MPTPCMRAFILATVLVAGPAFAQQADSKYLAPGFHSRPAGSKLVIVPADMELYSISAGGVAEPKEDWTEAAQSHFRAALAKRGAQLGSDTRMLKESEVDEFAELLALERAVGDSVFVHHSRPNFSLPTKGGRLDWSLGDAVRPLKAKTGADYALFTLIRDSYASNERKAVIIGMALLGSVNFGGEQVGYASLVDLNTGRVVWFNELYRMSGDLRDEAAAAETVDTLLNNFPGLE